MPLTGGEGPLAEVHDARELLTAALTLHDAGLGLRHPIVRLLGCEQDPHSDQLLALASSEDGLLAAFPMQYPASGSPAGGFTFGQPLYVMEGGHAEVPTLPEWLTSQHFADQQQVIRMA